MYITNKPKVAKIAESAGVDTIFVDMEFIGKDKRQGGQDTVQNHHTFQDIQNIKKAVTKSKVMLRINPIHKNYPGYCDSKEEIQDAIKAGADKLMLPWFKTAEEAHSFVDFVNTKAKTMLLLENDEAVENIDEILQIPGIDQIHIGLNDLSLCYGMKFMFQLMQDGTVEKLCKKIDKSGIKYGIGGIAGIGGGMLPTEYVIKEHYRLGSQAAILSRSFCNTDKVTDLNEVEHIFNEGVAKIRDLEKKCKNADAKYFLDNKQILDNKIKEIVLKLNK